MSPFDKPLRLQDHEIAEARRLLEALRELSNPLPSFLYDRYLGPAIADLDDEIRDYEDRLMARTYFVEYFGDDPIPYSYHVKATKAEAEEIEAWTQRHYSDGDPVVVEAGPITFAEFKRDVMDPVEDD